MKVISAAAGPSMVIANSFYPQFHAVSLDGRFINSAAVRAAVIASGGRRCKIAHVSACTGSGWRSDMHHPDLADDDGASITGDKPNGSSAVTSLIFVINGPSCIVSSSFRRVDIEQGQNFD